MSNIKAEFWRIEDERFGQLGDMGIEEIEFVNFRSLKFPDDAADKYARHRFMSTRPVKFTGGEMRIPFLPPGFDLNLFQHVGLMAAPEVAQSFQELSGDQIQLFPVAYEDNPQRFFYINMLKMFDCVDFERSGAEYNSKGRPYAINQLVLRKAAIDPDAQIFTMTFLTGTVIIRDALKQELLKRHQIKGSTFIPLTYS